MERKNRIEYIDIAKAFAIFCVVLGHTVSSDTFLKTVLYSFHMPVFFMLSGMVMQKKGEFSLGVYLKKKARLLLVPYFLWGVIYAQFSFKNIIYIYCMDLERLLCVRYP